MRLSSRSLIGSLVLLAAAAPVYAQSRRVLASDDPEAQLLGYYAAALYFSPVGQPAGRAAISGDLAVVPYLSADQRRVAFGGTKYEDSNKCPVAPRLRAVGALGHLEIEAGVVPPVRVCGVTATLGAVAIATRMPLSLATVVLLRGSVLAGQVSASFTCSANDVANPADQVCYQGAPSDDHLKPLTLGFDAGIVHVARGGLRLYATGGVRHERIDFDVNFENPHVFTATGTFADHGRLTTSLTRAQVAVGGELQLSRRLAAGAEWFYAPGALATLRASATWIIAPFELWPR